VSSYKVQSIVLTGSYIFNQAVLFLLNGELEMFVLGSSTSLACDQTVYNNQFGFLMGTMASRSCPCLADREINDIIDINLNFIARLDNTGDVFG